MIDRWRALPRGQRLVAAIVAVIVGLAVALNAVGGVLDAGPGGPPSSAVSTGADGLEGYADLLRGAGHPVAAVRHAITPADLPTGATAVIADPIHLGRSEADALTAFVRRGGRLLVTGAASAEIVAGLTGQPVTAVAGAPTRDLTVWVPTDLTGPATTLAGDGGTRWASLGSLVPLAGDGRGPVLVTAPVGRGRIVALADTRVLRNDRLARADNAALGLALAGPGRPVVFVESAHGATGTGLAAVPPSWKWTALGLALAGLLGLWAAGTRFGPAEPQRRALRPARGLHVDAVAAGLGRQARTPGGAAAPLLARERAAWLDRLGLPAEADPAEEAAAMARLGLDAAHRPPDHLADGDRAGALAVGVRLAAARRRRLDAPQASPDRQAPDPTATAADPTEPRGDLP